ncbi:hypothetical protein BCR36DRAFT_412361 [Piromyces finnis]|uniref:Lysozyme-like protein n=1 Tax=Piromyces finnis TaxID=1754191 RepID=A0A1Y1V9A2_9FUNG|nr:hypothetical protein BCR36DRAFT_412361 [Piromyces finnis]|eukprot:ORX50339.1 hypothetical protein BCR36DRAFT_412361 [Piromyces finnis]
MIYINILNLKNILLLGIGILLSFGSAEINNKCSSGNGICVGIKDCEDVGGTTVDGLCSGDSSSIKCCIKKKCYVDGSEGSCMFTSECKGTSYIGACPGGNNYQCCIKDDNHTSFIKNNPSLTKKQSNNLYYNELNNYYNTKKNYLKNKKTQLYSLKKNKKLYPYNRIDRKKLSIYQPSKISTFKNLNWSSKITTNKVYIQTSKKTKTYNYYIKTLKTKTFKYFKYYTHNSIISHTNIQITSIKSFPTTISTLNDNITASFIYNNTNEISQQIQTWSEQIQNSNKTTITNIYNCPTSSNHTFTNSGDSKIYEALSELLKNKGVCQNNPTDMDNYFDDEIGYTCLGVTPSLGYANRETYFAYAVETCKYGKAYFVHCAYKLNKENFINAVEKLYDEQYAGKGGCSNLPQPAFYICLDLVIHHGPAWSTNIIKNNPIGNMNGKEYGYLLNKLSREKYFKMGQQLDYNANDEYEWKAIIKRRNEYIDNYC